MSDYLSALLTRVFHPERSVRPRTGGRFEPAPYVDVPPPATGVEAPATGQVAPASPVQAFIARPPDPLETIAVPEQPQRPDVALPVQSSAASPDEPERPRPSVQKVPERVPEPISPRRREVDEVPAGPVEREKPRHEVERALRTVVISAPQPGRLVTGPPGPERVVTITRQGRPEAPPHRPDAPAERMEPSSGRHPAVSSVPPPRIIETRRAEAPRPEWPPGREQKARSEPTIRVTIGRVEVKAVTPVKQPATPPPPAPPRKPALSLDDYLKQRNGRSF